MVTMSKEYHQILDEHKRPIMGYHDEICLFPDKERAQAWIDYLKDDFEVKTDGFSIRKVKVITEVKRELVL